MESLEALIAACVKGDRRAFKRLYELTSPRLLVVLLRIVGPRAIAEEVLQEAYLTIWYKADHYRIDRGKPLTWMASIARNKAIDRLRQDRAGPREFAEWNDETAANTSVDLTDPALPQHLAQSVRGCLERLEGRQRKAIMLAFYFGMSHEEVSIEMGSPLGTTKSWIRRGLLQLKVFMDQ